MPGHQACGRGGYFAGAPRACKGKLPESVAIFDDAMKMLDSGLIDAVIVATPHYFHPQYVMAALSRGIHAMSEKPAGVYTKQVREMNEAAAKANAIFAMMFNQRTDHIYRKMREIVQSGELGAIRRTEPDYYQLVPSAGILRLRCVARNVGRRGRRRALNQCPHNLDYWQWICGMPPRACRRICPSASGTTLRLRTT